MNKINLEKISQKSVRVFIQDQIKDYAASIQDLRATYTKGDSLSEYLHHEESYIFPQEIEKTWDHYMTANPARVWNGSMLSFGLLVSKKDESVMYPGDEYSKADVGQVLYINLNILGGLIKVAVSHEIIEINKEKNFFEISYVKGSKSFGKQRIAFYPTSEGKTRIVHSTYYRSDSNFRDRYIYPYFHTKAISEYHENMRRSFSN